MARCDQGYLCRICGAEVEDIIDSELYLRFVIGEIDPETLHSQPECHLRCNPSLAQFITDARFDPHVEIEGAFSKSVLDIEFVRARSTLINNGYARLWEIMSDEIGMSVIDYPLDSVREKWQ
ncbi:MAG: hypothetical protein SGI77_21510 [Pirellulaceae bacterium]|nr:hypothetical protein [Pirellulaceae bacterium]